MLVCIKKNMKGVIRHTENDTKIKFYVVFYHTFTYYITALSLIKHIVH